jgi:RNA-directed DNA polymerase
MLGMTNELEKLLCANMVGTNFTQICEIEFLYNAWRKVRANRGSAGIDAVSWKHFEADLQNNLAELSRNLLNKTYRPLPVKFVKVMKTNGKMRELGILTIRDRIAQRAVLDAIEADFEAVMQDCNYAFRTGRNVEMAVQQIVVTRANGYWWTVESDIESYFPSINRDILMKDVSQIVTDKNILGLIEIWVNAGILEETWWQSSQKKISQANNLMQEVIGEGLDSFAASRNADNYAEIPTEYLQELPIEPFEAEKNKQKLRRDAVKGLVQDGLMLAISHRALLAKVLGAKLLGIGGIAVAGLALTPTIIETYRQFFHPRKGILQGSPMSPVLANLYLTEFDKAFANTDFKLIRYCDDFVILCKSEAEAKKAKQFAENLLVKRCLKLHPDKTKLLNPNDEFEFLGYKFLSSGVVEPPPTATNKMAQKIKEMSVNAKNRLPKFKVEKKSVKTWKEYFDIFGK